jgi:hypothetical protein
MFDTFTLVLGLRALAQAARAQELPQVPEPEFRRFVFPKREAAVEAAAANSTQSPRTLEELGIPRPYAAELEATFRAMGAVEDEQVVGFTFRTPDGVLHSLRASGGAAAAGRARDAGKAA